MNLEKAEMTNMQKRSLKNKREAEEAQRQHAPLHLPFLGKIYQAASSIDLQSNSVGCNQKVKT